MSRIAAGGTNGLLPVWPRGYVSGNAPNVCHLLRRDLRRARVLHRHRAHAPLSEDLAKALEKLDPGDRALLELSLQRGISDDELARVLGTDADAIGRRRRIALASVAHELDADEDEVATRIGDLPAESIRAADDEETKVEDAAATLHGGEAKTERKEEGNVGFFRSNSLSIFFLVIFLAALAGQSYAGYRAYNADQHDHEESGISYGRYVTSSSFGQAVTENWQSEYLQFVLYIMATIWFVQRGSPESKRVRERGREGEQDQELGDSARPDSPALARSAGGLGRLLYSNSLLVWMGLIWLASWFGQSVTGWSAYNSEQLGHGENGTNWIGYIGTSDFWESTLQNWQSEFLAVGSMAIFAVYLRQRGSPESKPVGAPHDETASSG